MRVNEIVRLKEILYDILLKHTGKPKDQIVKDADRDFFMSAMQAKEYGLVDDVLETMRPGTENSIAKAD